MPSKSTIVTYLLLSIYSNENVLANIRGSKEGRKLATDITGPCTKDALINAGISAATLASEIGSDADIEAACKEAYIDKEEIAWEDVIHKGRQFDKNFLDGEGNWNEHTNEISSLDDTAGFIDSLMEVAKTTPFELPGDDYLTNFNECKANAGMCCYVANRDGGDPEDNADVCYVEWMKNPRTNHVKFGYSTPYSIYHTPNAPDDAVYCHGFAWGEDDDSFTNVAKGSTMFYTAYKLGLVDKEYVRPVPGAPMCGCMEKMPSVSGSACVEAVEGYTYDAGTITANIKYQDCGKSLSEKMEDMADADEIPAVSSLIATRRTTGECSVKAAEYNYDHGYTIKE